MKFQCYTLGCKVNQYETQAMEQQLLALGHVSGTDADDCDAYLINTCTVTAVADRKNRTLIRRLRREHPQAVIGVCGCYAQVSAGEVEADHPAKPRPERLCAAEHEQKVHIRVCAIRACVDKARLRRKRSLLA